MPFRIHFLFTILSLSLLNDIALAGSPFVVSIRLLL